LCIGWGVVTSAGLTRPGREFDKKCHHKKVLRLLGRPKQSNPALLLAPFEVIYLAAARQLYRAGKLVTGKLFESQAVRRTGSQAPAWAAAGNGSHAK
jgi:hypothetical protein